MRPKGNNEEEMSRSELTRATAYSKLKKGGSFSASEEQPGQARGVCWESGGQPAKQGGPKQRQGLHFVLSAEESHLRGFVC